MVPKWRAPPPRSRRVPTRLGGSLQWLRAASPLAGPPSEQPSIYENSEPEPPAINIRQRAQELEDRPKIVKDLQAQGRQLAPTHEPEKMEQAYDRYLDDPMAKVRGAIPR